MTTRVAILGDSNSYGLGVRGRSHAVRYAERLDAEVLQLSRSAQTVAELTEEALAEVRRFRPDVVICSFGAAEGHVHPSRFLQALLDRFGPASWRGPAGLDPRPYYSRRSVRHARQLVVSRAKVTVKRLIIGATGGFHRLSSAELAARTREVLDALGPAPKVLVGLWRVDDGLFPRTNAVLSRHDEQLRAVAAERADVTYLPTAEAVRYWDDFLDDRAHLNDAGHDRVAGLLLAAATPNRANTAR